MNIFFLENIWDENTGSDVVHIKFDGTSNMYYTIITLQNFLMTDDVTVYAWAYMCALRLHLIWGNERYSQNECRQFSGKLLQFQFNLSLHIYNYSCWHFTISQKTELSCCLRNIRIITVPCCVNEIRILVGNVSINVVYFAKAEIFGKKTAG